MASETNHEVPEELKKLIQENEELSKAYKEAKKAAWAALLESDVKITAEEARERVAADPTVAEIKAKSTILHKKLDAELENRPGHRAMRLSDGLEKTYFRIYNHLDENIMSNGADVYHGYWMSSKDHEIAPDDYQEFEMEQDLWDVDADWNWVTRRYDPRPNFFLKWRNVWDGYASLVGEKDDAEAWVTSDNLGSQDLFKIDVEGTCTGKGSQARFADFHIRYIDC